MSLVPAMQTPSTRLRVVANENWKMLQVRMPESLKTAVRIYSAIIGKTETAWINGLVIRELKEKAPDLLRRVKSGEGLDDLLRSEE